MSTFPLTREQMMRGKNVCDRSRRQRSQKGAAASPWSKGPMVDSASARNAFARNPRFKR